MYEIHPILQKYMADSFINLDEIVNPLAKEFARKINGIIKDLIIYFNMEQEIDEKDLKILLIKRFGVSRRSLTNYLDKIKYMGVFEYDELTKKLRLPKDIIIEINLGKEHI